MSVMLAIAAEFSTVVRDDPITLERQAIFATMVDGNTLGLACRPGKGDIDVVFIPDGYKGPWRTSAVWSPKADSRFGSEAQPKTDAWYFDQGGMYYVGEGVSISAIKAKADFIDHLAKDTEFNIRWESFPNDRKTLTVSYTLDIHQLRDFIGSCGPKKVIARLREIGSSAAPD